MNKTPTQCISLQPVYQRLAWERASNKLTTYKLRSRIANLGWLGVLGFLIGGGIVAAPYLMLTTVATAIVVGIMFDDPV